MDIQRLDHANLRTTRLDEMVAWYRDVLGFEAGWRPDFGFPGAWLYRHGAALVHLVGAEDVNDNSNLTLEHVAFSAVGKESFRDRLEAAGVRYEEVAVPGTEIVQFNIWDPDGNHLHIDFIGES